ncbi:MAG TPA: AAA family ATPase [Geminicoccus sp.]|jgi:hypothetical protein|uniref:AAA family ATPase n=1 Tax=Geminicoccus sp. TaxID=2024832 RepID=UPI002E2ED69F|nr:AAA family ATPase [Geminicoccus sp.]HEX2526920.1 AAA family ATPase [Geminicoccus sp.]
MSIAADRMRAVLDEAPRYEPADDDVLVHLRGKARELTTVWSDEYQLILSEPGLVDGLLPSEGMTVLYAESGAGKTFVAVDLSCCIATGRSWRRMDVDPGIVIYVAAEAPESVQRRLYAWRRHHKVDHLPVLVVHSTINFLDTSDTDAVIAKAKAIAESHGPVKLTVVDTLARAMVGNENAPDDMGAFVAACGKIREATGGHVLVVHHCGKDLARGARGHSSLRAATDVELEITNVDGVGVIRVGKNRDESGEATFGFVLDVIELGINSRGRTVTTCVARAVEAPQAQEKRRELGPNEKIVFDALAAALTDHGQVAAASHDIRPGTRVVPTEKWQEAALRYLPHPELKRKTEAFTRSLTSLVAHSHVRHVGGFAWIP